MATKLKHVAFRTSALYWVAGVLWILLSDHVLTLLISDPATVIELQTYKGWFFVTVTTLLLFVTLRGQLDRWDREAHARKLAQQALEAANIEKDLMLKEIHHRVKNNLQIVQSLTNLQIPDAVDEHQKVFLHDIQGRIRAMAIVHERLYHSASFADVDLGELLHAIASELCIVYGEQNVTMDIGSTAQTIGIDDAIPIALIINELLTNAFRHAFPDHKKGRVSVTLHQKDAKSAELVVQDDGVGMPDQAHARKGPSMGMTLVHALTEQIGGTIAVHSENGTKVSIAFPTHSRVTAP
jgi:two-component system, sensor histidine kinase PdtaS